MNETGGGGGGPLTLLKVSLAGAVFVATKHVFCRDKSMLAATKVLSGQIRVCPDKTRLLSRQKYVCRYKHFVATSILLSQQKTCFVETNTCFSRQKFVATKMILVAAPAKAM